jgi:hypothetical protein
VVGKWRPFAFSRLEFHWVKIDDVPPKAGGAERCDANESTAVAVERLWAAFMFGTFNL